MYTRRRGTGTFPVCLMFGKCILLSTSVLWAPAKSEPLTQHLSTINCQENLFQEEQKYLSLKD